MDEKSTKDDENWMRCNSKSRAGQFYMFNKKTGENYWCTYSTVDSDATQQNFERTKTPAQDRLKRLQKNLAKKQSNPKAKDCLRTKKSEALVAKQTGKDKKDKQPPRVNKDCQPPALNSSTEKVNTVTKVSNPKPTLANETNLSQNKNDKSMSTEKIDTVTKVSNQKPTLGNDIPTKSVSYRLNIHKYNIPKKQPIQVENNSNKKKAAKRKQNDNEPTTVSSKHKKIDIPNGKSDDQANMLANSEEKANCDINANEEPKPGIISQIKGYCTNLFRQVLPAAKEYNLEEAKKQSNLAYKSSFANRIKKYPLQDNQSEKPPPIPHTIINTRITYSSFRNNANERLQRLRKTLQDQRNQNPRGSTANTVELNEPSIHSNDSECESMDWQPIGEEPDKNTTLLNTSAISPSPWDTVNENLLRLSAEKTQQKRDWKTDHFYFIIDTNIIIENVTFIDELTTLKFCDTAGTIIYVPYCVLQELDNLKLRETIKIRTTRAIQFLNKAFEKKSQHFQAQSSEDENKHLINVRSSDDSILNCCLQVREHIENVMLLTDDVNLRNKAICSDILVSTRSDLISKHESLL